MQEPTAQEKFEAATVTAPDGTPGSFDQKTGVFKPYERSKEVVDLEIEMRKRKQKVSDDMAKAYFEEFDAPMDPAELEEASSSQTALEFGVLEEPQDSINPSMDDHWPALLSSIGPSPTELDMLQAMSRHAQVGMKRGLTLAEAQVDFLQRWQKGIGGGLGHGRVPKMSIETQQILFTAQANTLAGDPDVAETLLGGPQAQPAPTQTQPPPVGEVRVIHPDGRTGTIPIADKDEALAKGFKLVE